MTAIATQVSLKLPHGPAMSGFVLAGRTMSSRFSHMPTTTRAAAMVMPGTLRVHRSPTRSNGAIPAPANEDPEVRGEPPDKQRFQQRRHLLGLLVPLGQHLGEGEVEVRHAESDHQEAETAKMRWLNQVFEVIRLAESGDDEDHHADAGIERGDDEVGAEDRAIPAGTGGDRERPAQHGVDRDRQRDDDDRNRRDRLRQHFALRGQTPPVNEKVRYIQARNRRTSGKRSRTKARSGISGK